MLKSFFFILRDWVHVTGQLAINIYIYMYVYDSLDQLNYWGCIF